jgi:DNA-binding NarL/FixJ family response regulator
MNRPLTVIIAEDKPQDREKMEQYAHDMGLKVLSSVASGEWLIDDCIRYKPDIVFLNVGLYGTDGLSAYERILQYGVKPYLLMVSGTQDSSVILAGLKMNCIDFISKPVSLERLSEAVEKVRRVAEKDILFSKAIPGRIIQVKSSYRTVFINENNLIYAHKLKGAHKTVVYVDGELEEPFETTTSLTEILSQCSQMIFMPNQSNLINVNFIKKVFASDRTLGNYIIKLLYNDVEIELTRRKRKMFEQSYNQKGLASLCQNESIHSKYRLITKTADRVEMKEIASSNG